MGKKSLENSLKIVNPILAEGGSVNVDMNGKHLLMVGRVFIKMVVHIVQEKRFWSVLMILNLYVRNLLKNGITKKMKKLDQRM